MPNLLIKMEILSILFAINYWKIGSELLLHLKSKVCPKYLLFNCLWKHFFASNSPQGPLNLTLLIIFKKLKLLNAKLEAWRCNKVLKFVLLENYFSRTLAKEFFLKKRVLSSQNVTVFNIWSCQWSHKRLKKSFTYNHGHNILRHFRFYQTFQETFRNIRNFFWLHGILA